MDTLKPGPAPTGRDKIFDALYGALGGKPENRWAADKLTTAIDFGTLGMLTGAYDGGRELAETGRPGALAMALMPGAKVARPAVEAAETATRQGIRAFHGSPHDFDKFSLDKIGTGEGAQAYGHGLYFAESEGVAKSYRDQLSDYSNSWRWTGPNQPNPEQLRMLERLQQPNPHTGEPMTLESMDLDFYKLGASARRMLSSEYVPEATKAGLQKNIESARAGRELIKTLQGNVEFTPPGRMYEVRINAEPDQFLDWDKPLSEQGEKVRQVFKDFDPSMKAGEAHDRLQAQRHAPAPINTGNPKRDALMEQMRSLEILTGSGRKSIREDLLNQGIPGIRYLDQGSRTAGEGSRNYVVFDDALIEILRKYGLLPPAAGAGLAAALQSDPAQATP